MLLMTFGMHPAFADATPATKAPEVSTVGAGPYSGPLPEELAKLAQMVPSAAAPAIKAANTITVGPSSMQPPTPEALAKLAEYLATPVTLPLPEMSKLEAMQVPTEGTPALTPEELEKRANELAARRANLPTAPSAPKSAR